MFQVGSTVGATDTSKPRVAGPESFWDDFDDHGHGSVSPEIGRRTPFSLLDPEDFHALGFDVAGAACLESLARCMPAGWSVGEGQGRLLDPQGRVRTELLSLSVEAHVVSLKPRYSVGVVVEPAADGQSDPVVRVAVLDAGRPVRMSAEFAAADVGRRTQELVWMSQWLDLEVPTHQETLHFWDGAPASAIAA